ncbi:MAG TPA: hypothetical protein DCP10_08015, partial [Bacteroidales bacterium]|nr:hypothetical protein [Bacteroidales bacterium]
SQCRFPSFNKEFSLGEWKNLSAQKSLNAGFPALIRNLNEISTEVKYEICLNAGFPALIRNPMYVNHL